MKFGLGVIVLVVVINSVHGQGLVYDQQSANDTADAETPAYMTNQPFGQSFTPTLSAIDFVSFQFADGNSGNGIGASVYVNLWSGAISNSTLLSSTAPVFMPDGFGIGTGASRITNFFFQTSVALTLGTNYFLQPVLQSGDPGWIAGANVFNYAGGTLVYAGIADPFHDLWFREGIVAAPEPSSLALLLIASGTWLFVRRRSQ